MSLTRMIRDHSMDPKHREVHPIKKRIIPLPPNRISVPNPLGLSIRPSPRMIPSQHQAHPLSSKRQMISVPKDEYAQLLAHHKLEASSSTTTLAQSGITSHSLLSSTFDPWIIDSSVTKHMTGASMLPHIFELCLPTPLRAYCLIRS